jgi:hypothetical protein
MQDMKEEFNKDIEILKKINKMKILEMESSKSPIKTQLKVSE